MNENTEKIQGNFLIIIISNDYKFSAGLQKQLTKIGLAPMGFFAVDAAVEWEKNHQHLQKLYVLDVSSINANLSETLQRFHDENLMVECIALLPESVYDIDKQSMANQLRIFTKSETVCTLLPDYISKWINLRDAENELYNEETHSSLNQRPEPGNMEHPDQYGPKDNYKTRSAFLTGLSEEMRNPLNLIFIKIQKLMQTQLNLQQMQTLDTVRGAAESLQRVVHSLLNSIDRDVDSERKLPQDLETILNIQQGTDAGQVASDMDIEYLKDDKRNLRILVAEDDAISLLYLAAFLRSQGWAVDTAYNGKAVIKMFEPGKYDLIILDGQMPVMDGYEAAKIIRETEPTDSRTPILAISGYAIPGDRERFMSSGMDEYLPKPVNESRLLAMIYKLTE